MKQNVAIITGGTRGIGLGIAKVFLENEYSVALVYRDDAVNAKAVEKQLASTEARCFKADITKKIERDKLLDEVKHTFGRFDVLINNAGILRMGRLLDVTEKDFREVTDCNFHAPIFLAQAFAQELVNKKQTGSIVNILSIGAYRAGNLAYCASKAALLSATKSMAHELAKYDIRVNSVSPFGVATELNRKTRDKNPEAWEKLVKKAPMKRSADPIEIAGAVLYLTSDTASFTTGVDIPVDGGLLTR